MKGTAVLIPRTGKGYGYGHLHRAALIAKNIGEGASIYLENSYDKDRILRLLKGIRITEDPWKESPWDLVILDRRETEKELLAEYEKLGPVVGIDEGGEARRYIPYLIDSLVAGKSNEQPNYSFSVLPGIPLRDIQEVPLNRILITFGGEDPEDLTAVLLEKLKKDHFFNGRKISVVEGPLFKRNVRYTGTDVIHCPDNLIDIIPAYDLVITSYGLTCFESLAGGVPVILFNPTGYHRKLSKASHLPEIGVRRPDIKKLKRLIVSDSSPIDTVKEWQRRIKEERKEQHNIPESLIFSGNMQCPFCRGTNSALIRFKDRTYYRCTQCGLIYSSVFNDGRKVYNNRYFFNEYQSQYGRTYLEDFKSIKKTAFRRISVIKEVASKTGVPEDEKPSVLDIGCAYGPFLDAAGESGYIPAGIDVSGEAVEYVKKALKIDAFRMNFMNFTGGVFDVITMWYVIEHFEDPDAVLKKINRHLKCGGVFAFSTPNGKGISGCKNKKAFLAESPADHYTIWNPLTARTLLKRYGFRVKKICITGHHPERFPLYSKLLHGILDFISGLLGLGDTFEVYAVKIKDMQAK
ncbi:MAG: methyltransferase domain-containing protein [Spirochaetes bacterium]|nr:methyltransferase domain-containing protein [Spirochaetota bacterium]